MSAQQVIAIVLDFEKLIASGFDVTASGFNVKYKKNSVLLMVKAWNRGGQPIIAYIEAPTVSDCFYYLYKACTTTGAPMPFRPDRYGKPQEG